MKPYATIFTASLILLSLTSQAQQTPPRSKTASFAVAENTTATLSVANLKGSSTDSANIKHPVRYFDSTAYARFYENKWNKFTLDTTNYTNELTEAEKIRGLSTCWSQAKYNFANFDLVPNLNWDSLYTSFIPKVILATSTSEYYKILQNFYQYLHDGHTAVTEPVYKLIHTNGILPVQIRWIQNKAIVTTVTSASKQYNDIKPGFELVAIEHLSTRDYIAKNISPFLNYSTSQDSIERIYRYGLSPGMAGTSLHFTFKDPKGTLHEKELVREVTKSVWQPEKNTELLILPGNIAYLKVNTFSNENVVKEFDSLFQYIAPSNALIIDIRDNGGGNSQNGYEILGCLTNKPFYPGKTALRHFRPVGLQWGGIEKPEIEGNDWKPYKNRLYKNQVVLLTSAATYSAAEDFTCAFKYMKRGKIFGSATGGSTGQPIMFNLPGGGFGRVCGKRDFFWDGLEFVGIGIQPDVEVRPSVEGIAAGKDEVLEAAIRYLRD